MWSGNITFTSKSTVWVNKTKFGFDSVFMAGDTITLYLDQDTNMGSWNVESMLNTEVVNQLMLFSRSIGSIYTGRWHNQREFRITLQSVSSAEQSLPDVLLISFRNAANLRNWPPQSAPMDESLQQLLCDDFGPSVINVSSMEDMPLKGITKDQIDTLFIFSQSLSSDYRAKWDSARAITIQVVNDRGSAPPSIGGLWLGIRPEGNLRNLPPSHATSNANYPSVKLVGDFGPSNIFITDFFAEDADNLDDEFSSGDSLLVTFSHRTNQGGLPGLMNKQQLDSLLTFTYPIGANYTGQWSSDSTKIYIYIYEATGGVPQLFVSTASVKSSGNLRN